MHDQCSDERMGFGHRIRRGNMAPIILTLLLERPMHGYEIISSLSEKSHGLWRPSAGSIYPNLQLLEEQEMVKCEEKDGKKVYTLTDKGRASAEEAKDHLKNRFEGIGGSIETFKALRLQMFKLKGAMQEVAGLNDEEATKKAKQILDEAQTKLMELVSKAQNDKEKK